MIVRVVQHAGSEEAGITRSMCMSACICQTISGSDSCLIPGTSMVLDPPYDSYHQRATGLLSCAIAEQADGLNRCDTVLSGLRIAVEAGLGRPYGCMGLLCLIGWA